MFDPDLIFRDQETKEVFVFDKYGIWNSDTLKHKLLFWFRIIRQTKKQFFDDNLYLKT